MSLAATMWAWEQKQVKGSTKLVLLCFAEHYNDEKEVAWPSSPAVVEATGLDRKTIISCLSELREKGLIEDSEKRTGRTNQIVVYRLPGVPEFRKSVREIVGKQAQKRTTSDDEEQAQKRNSTENGTVPFFPSNRPVFPVEQAQKRATEPLMEPLMEPLTADSPNRPPPCPHKAILNLYHEILPEMVFHETWEGSRKTNLAKLWRSDPRRQTLDYWRELFEWIRLSDFLMGRTQSREPFECSLEWIVGPKNFAKISEKKYHPKKLELA